MDDRVEQRLGLLGGGRRPATPGPGIRQGGKATSMSSPSGGRRGRAVYDVVEGGCDIDRFLYEGGTSDWMTTLSSSAGPS